MITKTISRRNVIKAAGIYAGASFLGISATPVPNGKESSTKLKILVIGAHPDDPETIAGGAMALFSKSGHEVVSVYLTHGEAGIPGKNYEEAARIRTDEALKACNILGVRAEFLTQIDGSCEITQKRYAEMIDFVNREKPDVVFTHWPIDTHRDHRICSNLVYDAWLRLNKKFSLYYCEAMTGTQSQTFSPTDYLDISSVIDLKHKACFIHQSQKMEEEYAQYHGRMEVFRGMENNCDYAEAFVKQAMSPKEFRSSF